MSCKIQRQTRFTKSLNMSMKKSKITFDENILDYVRYSRKINGSILNDRLIKSSDNFGSLLHYAARHTNAAVVRQLIALGSEVDSVGRDGQTPFMLAVELGSAELAEIFLKAKANFDIVDNSGRSVLQRVFENFNYVSPLVKLLTSKVKTKRTSPKKLAKRLIAAGCKMYEAATLRDVKVMKCMLDQGIDINSKNPDCDRTALHRAAEMDDEDIANWLINNGADVNAVDKRASVIHLAACWRRKKVLKILLERGADPNQMERSCYCCSYSGFSPLVAVCVNRDELENVEDGDECVKLLLQHGAIIDRRYNSMLDFALDSCSNEGVKMLIGQQAMLELIDKSITGKMMFYKAVSYDQYRLTELQEFYQLCLQVLTTKLFEDLSLLDLLNANETRLNSMVRRKTFVSNVKKIGSKHKLSESHFFYYDTLMKRINKAIRVVKLEDKAIFVICKLFGCSYNQCHNFAREIVSYLKEYELERLIQV